MRTKSVLWPGIVGTLAVTALGLAACQGAGGGGGPPPPAQIVNRIISTQLVGNADDGDSATTPDNYGPAGGNRSATDGSTKASSEVPKFNQVAGKAEAENANPAAPTNTNDVAEARSFNKVVCEFRVNAAGAFTFDIDLDIDGIDLRHDGTLTIQVAAAILDANGVAVPMGGITNVTLEIRRNAAGTAQVVIAGDTANPEPLDADGGYARKLSGPNQGVQLQPGNYRIELDLRLTARALVQTGPDGRSHRAAIGGAKATITLRP